MQIIPAVDIKEGRCVRLSQGKADQETVYSDDPVSVARHWAELGARLIHVVDLDGAFAGKPVNADLVKRIVDSAGASVQVGGGIRTLRAIEDYVRSGVSRVVLGTSACQNPAFVKEACAAFPGMIVIGIDARDGYAAIKGWVEVSSKKATELAESLAPLGIAGFIFTDISRDGMLRGPNLNSVREFAESARLPVIASGGVSRLEDVSALLALKPLGVSGIIIGKALYDKTLNYKDALNRVANDAG